MMNTNTLRQSGRRLGAGAVAAIILLGMALPPVTAQVSQVDEPYVVVVDTQTAPLRCGADELYYEVAELKQGEMLLVDASDTFGIDGDGWLRVSFPAEQPALIKALPEHLDVDVMRGTITLLRPSRLVALSIDGDLSQSWKKLLTKPMKPGSTLKILETIRDENGQALAYIVPAPEQARGFIHGRFVRQANAAETRAFHDGQITTQTAAIAAAPAQQEVIAAPTPEMTPETAPKLAATEPVQEGEPVTTVARVDAQPAHGDDVGALLGVDREAHEAMPEPAGEIAGAETTAGTTEEAPAMDQTHAASPLPTSTLYIDPDSAATTLAGADEDDFEVYQGGTNADDDAEVEPVMAEPLIENRPLPTLRDLETAYSAVLAQKATMAEVDPLISEHERYLAAMDRGEAPGDDLDREVLVAHLELLKIRSDLQRSMLRIEGVREQAKRSMARIEEGIAGIDRSSEYVVVGRLTTSVVYDGKRLPLLYRVQSIDEDAGRTLAYVVPAGDVDLAGSLGSIVGVAGSARVDASSRLNIVTPTRIDRLRSTASAQ